MNQMHSWHTKSGFCSPTKNICKLAVVCQHSAVWHENTVLSLLYLDPDVMDSICRGSTATSLQCVEDLQ